MHIGNLRRYGMERLRLTSPAIVDPGLQIERTRMSWQRTMLSTATLLVVSMRILPQCYGYGGYVVGIVLGGTLAYEIAMHLVRRVRFYDWFVKTDRGEGDASGRHDISLCILSSCFSATALLCLLLIIAS